MTDLEKARQSAHHHLAKVRHHLAEASAAVERCATQLGAPAGELGSAPAVAPPRTAVHEPEGGLADYDKPAVTVGDDFRKAFGERPLESGFQKAAARGLLVKQVRDTAATLLPEFQSAINQALDLELKPDGPLIKNDSDLKESLGF
jgi:hypothetical protein